MIENGVESKGQNQWRASRGKRATRKERARQPVQRTPFVCALTPVQSQSPIAHNSGRRVIGGRSTQRRHRITEPIVAGSETRTKDPAHPNAQKS